MCIWIFSTNFVETFLILRWTEQDMIKNVYWFLCKVPAIYSDFNETRIFSADFPKIFKCHENPFSGSGVVSYGRTDGRRDTCTDMTKLTVAFL